MSERNIKIKTDLQGHGTVELHGRDISKHVAGMDIKMRAGRPTQVTIYLPPIETDIGVVARAELVTITHALLAPEQPPPVEVPEDVEVVNGHWIVTGHVEHDADCPGCRAIRA